MYKLMKSDEINNDMKYKLSIIIEIELNNKLLSENINK